MAYLKPVFIAAALALSAPGKAQARPAFDLEADPIDFALGGYRLHAGLTHARIRYDLGILKVEIPRAIHGNDRFAYRISGIIGRIDYVSGGAGPGWFAGMEGTMMENVYTHLPTRASDTRHPFLLAARSGYRFRFFGHLTVTPWVGLGALLNKGGDHVAVGNDRFEVGTWNVFPTVHAGWAF